MKHCHNCGYEEERVDEVIRIGWGLEEDADLCLKCIDGLRKLGLIGETEEGAEYVSSDALIEHPVPISVSWQQIVCACVREEVDPAGFDLEMIIDSMKEVLLDEWMEALTMAVGWERDRVAADTPPVSANEAHA